MCDFSLQSVRSRPAQVGDKLVTRDFGTGTRGFSASDDAGLAVCIRPGTELAFAGDVACLPAGLLGWTHASSRSGTVSCDRRSTLRAHRYMGLPVACPAPGIGAGGEGPLVRTRVAMHIQIRRR
jgi:hypothetical protein